MEMERDFTVAFRIRPSFLPATSDPPLITTDPAAKQVVVAEPRTRLTSSLASSVQHTFDADSCYLAESTTELLFTTHIHPLIPFVLSGGYLTVLAYGQTGSGKTHTLSACSRLAIHSLFSANTHCDIAVQAIEIYGKKINDLFDPTNTQVSIAETIHGTSTFCRATVQQVLGADEMIQAVDSAWSARVTRGTEKNPQSSRSHALIRISCRRRGDGNAVEGVMQLVDLAGSERAADHSASHASKERIAETVAINTSLMTLKQCIRARTGGEGRGPPHIPFRSSKLTLALKEAFDLYARQPTHTLFIATASPDPADLAATLNTFRYASALQSSSPRNRIELQPDPQGRNVFFWSPDRLATWLVKYGAPLLNHSNVNKVAEGEDGMRFSKIPEQTFYTRFCTATGSKEDKAARELYLRWWKLVIASRTLSAKALEAQWKQRQAQKSKQEDDETRQDVEVQRLLRLESVRAATQAGV